MLPTRPAWDEQRSGLRRERARAQDSAQGLLSHTWDAGRRLRRIPGLEVKDLILPIIVGGLLAFLFRPVKDRFHVRWLPHELQVLCSFALIGLVLFFAFNTLRKHIPDEQQKLEFKVRLKYKLNERYRQLVAKSPEGKSNAVTPLIEKEAGPLMDKINQALELNPEERNLFLKYAVRDTTANLQFKVNSLITFERTKIPGNM